MTSRGRCYRYRFTRGVPLEAAEQSLQLAVLAAEGLFGTARLMMDGGYTVDPTIHVIVVDAGSPVGTAINAMFTHFLVTEFGAGTFSVQAVEAEGRR